MIRVYPIAVITIGWAGQITRIGGREIETFGGKA
jgi:hypothetical protein